MNRLVDPSRQCCYSILSTLLLYTLSLTNRPMVKKHGRPPTHLMTMWHEYGGLELTPLWLCSKRYSRLKQSCRYDSGAKLHRVAPQSDLYSHVSRSWLTNVSRCWLKHGAKSRYRCLYQPHGPLFYVTSYGSGLQEWRTGIIES